MREQVVSQVLDELGIQMSEEMGNLPVAAGSLNPAAAAAAKNKKAQAEGSGGGALDADADLEARLENLRRS